VRPPRLPPSVAARAIAEAITGYVTIDLVLEVAAGLGVLPQDTVTIELEPVRTGPADGLSREAEAALEEALALVRVELRGPQASSTTPTC
jgi:hypothetical protein